MSDALGPWILNTITDHKTRFIPYSKWICLGITQTWSVYCNIMSVFSIFLAMSQIDFVLIRMLADLSVNAYTTTKFMRNKTHCPRQYRLTAEQEMSEVSADRNDSNEPASDTTPLQRKQNEVDSPV
jgi:hypothetical protein